MDCEPLLALVGQLGPIGVDTLAGFIKAVGKYVDCTCQWASGMQWENTMTTYFAPLLARWQEGALS